VTRLLMLVEGQSEEVFVKRTLAPYLAERRVYVQPIVLWTKRLDSGSGFRGGVSDWNQIRRSLDPLTQDSDAWVTTLLDFYGLPEDFPGYREAREPGDPRQRVAALQQAFAEAIRHPRFVPFLALHEFEAWVFTAPDKVAEHFGTPGLAARIRRAGDPELIDLDESSHPKARLRSMNTGYKETSDGPTLLEKIGIDAIRGACPHFAAWLTRLEALGETT
jgi:Domain of unknown function (DUF4276)